MTNKEEETIHRLCNLMDDIREENRKFREDINTKVDTYTVKVDKKVEPIYLEQDIMQITKQSIQKAIQESLTKYDSPLILLVKSVVQSHSTELRELINDAFEKSIRTEDFKEAIIDAFSHKVARTIMSNSEGMFDKVANELKQDAIFKSKMALAVANIVNECLQERKSN